MQWPLTFQDVHESFSQRGRVQNCKFVAALSFVLFFFGVNKLEIKRGLTEYTRGIPQEDKRKYKNLRQLAIES